ncbi:hypothetical protein [Pseudomonas sp. 8 R 14]|nr:hypothetical protein [Pseudomonas sp. 8 R 14]
MGEGELAAGTTTQVSDGQLRETHAHVLDNPGTTRVTGGNHERQLHIIRVKPLCRDLVWTVADGCFTAHFAL